MTNLEFEITATGPISEKFLAQNNFTFSQAATYVRQLPYRRNKNKADLASIFTDGCGTCSTKHAILKVLADENGYKDLRLMLGIFRMSLTNTPKISTTLRKHRLEYIPEAHNYLKWKNQTLDYTHKTSKPTDFISDLIEEIEIEPHQIIDFKVAYHKQFLARWLNQNPALNLTLSKLWAIREDCIVDLSIA